MRRPLSWLVAAALIAVSTTTTLAASRAAWDGTWSGMWGGKTTETTSITVSGERVVSYSYQGVSHPVASSSVTARKITYEDQGNSVTLTRTGETTAHAALHTSQGDATAELKRQ